MSTIVTRSGKGSPLSHVEVDANFTNLNTDKYQSGSNASFGTLAATGVTTFSAGSVSAPAITTTGDTNTGIFFPAADTIAFTEGGVESMRINSTGNLGLGVTPSAWESSTYRAMQISTGVGSSSLISRADSVNGAGFVLNGYYSATGWKYVGSSYSTLYLQNAGTHQWYTSASGTADNLITFSESMRIGSTGNVGIGTTTLNQRLNVQTASGFAATQYSNGTGNVVCGVDNTNNGYLSTETANAFTFLTSGTERMRIDASGNVGIGTTSPAKKLTVNTAGVAGAMIRLTDGTQQSFDIESDVGAGGAGVISYNTVNGGQQAFKIAGTERMRIDSSGDVFVAKTAQNVANAGCELRAVGMGVFTNTADVGLVVNRNTDDGDLVLFRQANTTEGTISVSGTTVSYNGGHLSRWSQLPDGSKDDTLLKGTVMSNLDNMCVWEKDGVVADNEQLNKMKVSDVEGDANVAGVFVNWTMDEQYGVDDMNVAMTGDMIIRIADGVVVQKGDLLMSAGDGTAKPQGDDIVRSKTIAKVTSNYVTCTYADGSYCVPCVLMAC